MATTDNRLSRLQRILILPIAATVLLAGAACGGDSSAVPASAIAVVGKQTVTKAELDRLLDQTRASSERSRSPFPKPGTGQYQQIRDQLVQFLVRRAQLAAEADARGIGISDEHVEQRRAWLVRQYFGGNEKLYEERLEENGSTEEQMRAELKAALIEEALLKDVGKEIEVSDAEMRKHYGKNKGEYAIPAKREIRQILLKKEQGALADRLARQLRAGASFERLARRYSQDPRSNAASRQEISKGETGEAFDRVVFSIATHKISDPIQTSFGWHVIEALGPVQPPRTPRYEHVKTAIREDLLQAKRGKANEAYVQRIVRKHSVDYQAGFAPPL
jgi:parvulin-like peptidyl-prolyl isomerase